jgi:hypothetical protein
MANLILKNDEVILKCANWALDLLYKNILEIIQEKKIEVDEQLNDFLSRLDQDVYGLGSIYLDVMVLDESNRDKLQFLTEKAIEKIKQKGETGPVHNLSKSTFKH